MAKKKSKEPTKEELEAIAQRKERKNADIVGKSKSLMETIQTIFMACGANENDIENFIKVNKIVLSGKMYYPVTETRRVKGTIVATPTVLKLEHSHDTGAIMSKAYGILVFAYKSTWSHKLKMSSFTAGEYGKFFLEEVYGINIYGSPKENAENFLQKCFPESMSSGEGYKFGCYENLEYL